jgi:hypothetical protein
LKRYKTYIAFAAVFVAVYFLVQAYAPRELNWAPTYVSRDKIPFGTSALREMMDRMSAYSPVKTVYQPIYSQFRDAGIITYYNIQYYDTTHPDIPDSLRHNYLFINSEFKPSGLDVNWLLWDVKKGDNVMICAKDICDSLCHALHISLSELLITKPKITTTLFQKDLQSLRYNYSTPQYISWQSEIELDSISNSDTKVLGEICSDSSVYHPNFVCININTQPELFTNYYLVNDTTYTYAFNCLNVLNNKQPTWWDEYYKAGRIESGSSLEFIFSQPSLRLSWYIFLITMILYALFESKRRQKAIAIIAPVQNDSLEFVKILGGFYFKTSEHRNMAEKKWRFLTEYIRSKYNINYDRKDTTFAEKLSRKSGYPLDEVTAMLNMAIDYLRRDSMTEEELMQLNHSINKFYNYTKNI